MAAGAAAKAIAKAGKATRNTDSVLDDVLSSFGSEAPARSTDNVLDEVLAEQRVKPLPPLRSLDNILDDVIEEEIDIGEVGLPRLFSPENRTGRTNFDEDMQHLADKNGWTYETINMTPDEYIDEATVLLQRMEDNPRLTREEVERTRLDSFPFIKEKMLKHGDFDIPYLDYTGHGGQEGINRAMAARDLGEETIPVRVIRQKAEN